VKRRISIFRRPHGYLHLRRQRREDRAIGPYDYIRYGETSEKVGCSIRSVWVGAGVALDERGYGEVWGIQGGVDGHKISIFLKAWFSCDEQKDRQEGLFFNLGCTGREATCFFCKHMKLRNQARLCLAIYDFEVRIMLSLYLTFNTYQTTGMRKI